ncbi:hypothetical protein HF888_04135 [Bermanella marisrubri]|uniref:Type 4 fimbrial biogenesis protein PilX N-terminal domain-containing protein n=1 Tax=Bermanella marisrubri TaxID=207949 RepID=Q1MYR9_9GAMM|nr:PilX N-terminal domain-containing pilus assembly protein [Bermanella marisrubri]EAT11137.1 hypothetical protein RED65_05064 [Oceanobacter sp. RED65] [Bermanella marisrubri]QIZ83461.1 hypothetical protein HF888_04135 [Bermanella marisrubri]
MKNQQGSTLVTALIILTVITLVAVYSLESSNIQEKMVANSLFSTLTYQECRNEQESNVRYYNLDGGTKREELLVLRTLNPRDGNTPLSNTLKTQSKSDMSIEWSYLSESPAGKSGVEVDIQSPIRVYQYENDCIAQFRFAQSNQTLGALVEGLKSAGNIK